MIYTKSFYELSPNKYTYITHRTNKTLRLFTVHCHIILTVASVKMYKRKNNLSRSN